MTDRGKEREGKLGESKVTKGREIKLRKKNIYRKDCVRGTCYIITEEREEGRGKEDKDKYMNGKRRWSLQTDKEQNRIYW